LLKAIAAGELRPSIQEHVHDAFEKYRRRNREDRWSQAYLDAEEERVVSLMEEWLDYEAKRADFRVEAGEKKLEAAVGDLQLQVRVDRIDSIPGGHLLIDYKTGQLSKVSWDGERPDEPQLPLYAGFTQIDNLKGVLLARVREEKTRFLGRAEEPRLVMPSDTRGMKPYDAAMLEEWQRVLLRLAQQFLQGEAQVDPKEYPKSCEFCDLAGLCRIAESDPVSSADDAEQGDD
jgi:ATP-dependent helicase/nuclease subunit B